MNNFIPEKPIINPECCEEKFHSPNCPNPPLPPGFNPCIPQITPVPPVPSPIEGSSLYECMGQLTQRVNTCIEQWNGISRNCYEALNKIVAAARSNDVYYDSCEVKYINGYDEIEGCTYAIVKKNAVDRKNNPIFVTLYPAYNNPSNPGVNQHIFDASYLTSANVIITAVQAGQTNWNGPALLNGSEIPGTALVDGYVYGFTKRGALRYFPSNVTATTLCQQGMKDVIGGCIPLVYDGKVLDDIPNSNSKMAITAIGFNSGDGSVIFFSCSAQDEPGITLNGVARILTEYGCTIGVCTSSTVNESTTEVSEGMLYMGQMTASPIHALQPNNVAYWVVSKQHCFRNKFEEEIAHLVQTTGRNMWETYLLGVQIQSFDDRIANNTKAIAEEVARATQAEGWLQENINSEVNRALQAEEWLQENINKEVNRATEAEKNLDNKIVSETERATASENAIKSDLNDEVLRATNREREIQSALDSEISKRISADNDIINSIEQEILARRAADTDLRTLIEQVQSQTNVKITQIQEQVDGITGGQTELPYLKLTGGNLTGNVTMSSSNTITVGRGPTANNEVATKKYVDDQIAGGITAGGDVSKEYVDEQINNIQGQLDDKVNKAGDTMSGSLNMNGNKIENPVLSANLPITVDNGANGPGMITNVTSPTNDLDVTNKKYVDEQIAQTESSIEEGLGNKFLPITGGNMTGDINMTGSSVISFYDEIPQTNPLARSGQVASQIEQGSIYNDENAIVVKSENGGIKLIGSEVVSANTDENPIAMIGVNKLQLTPGSDAGTNILLNEQLIQLGQALVAIGSNGSKNGVLQLGGVTIYDDAGNIAGQINRHNQHIDINVSGENGSLYINKTGTSGGTGQTYVSKINSPNDLQLSPGTTVNVLSHRITEVSNGVNANDAVNLSQLNQLDNKLNQLDNKLSPSLNKVGSWSLTYDVNNKVFIATDIHGNIAASSPMDGLTFTFFKIVDGSLYYDASANMNLSIITIPFNVNFLPMQYLANALTPPVKLISYTVGSCYVSSSSSPQIYMTIDSNTITLKVSSGSAFGRYGRLSNNMQSYQVSVPWLEII